MRIDPAALTDLIGQLHDLQLSQGGAPPTPPPLNPPLGHGSGGGMEPRLAKLEAHMEHVRGQLGRLDGMPVALSDLAGKVNIVEKGVADLPNKEWVRGAMRNWVGGAVAFLTLVTIGSRFVGG